ncbi:TonB-dependent receptor [candidate division KSB1 bacterium]|nr:TonB-dependent receptor [candidate division KSB1 bacterium]
MRHDTVQRCDKALMLVLLFFSLPTMGGEIAGLVYDVSTGKPLPNANIVVEGTDLGAASDINGKYRIQSIPAGDYIVRVSYVGYDAVEKKVILQTETSPSLDFPLRESFFQMQQVVVTATRDQRLLEDVPVVTEVISRQEINDKGAEDLAEILEDRPGIMVETGSSGDKLFFMNGVDSKRILILVDGLPISGKVNSRNPIDLVDADNIQHVEIVKGPGSPLYGSDAMGGVINIITENYADELRVYARGRAGSNDLYSGTLGISGRSDKLSYAANADYVTRGFNQASSEIQINDAKSNSLNGTLRYNSVKIGFFQVGSSYKQDEQNSESAFMGGLSDNTAKNNNLSAHFVWDWDVSKVVGLKIYTFTSNNERTYKSAQKNSSAAAAIDTTTDNLWGVKSDFTVQAAKWAKIDLGVDYTNNIYKAERLPDEKNRLQSGLFAQLETEFASRLTFIIGGRYDKITELAGHFSPRLSALYAFFSDLKMRASWGGGFRAPSFVEQYSDFPIPIPGVPLRVVGNPDLKPEQSRGGNFGVEYFWNNKILTNLTLFQNMFEDMIVDYQKDRFTYSYLNTKSATFRGVELQSRLSFTRNFKSTLSYNYTQINQKDQEVAISKISPHTAFVRLTYGLLDNKLHMSLRGQYFSQRDILVVTGHGGGYEKVKKDGYTTLDLTFSYQLGTMLTLRFGSTNLTDYIDENYGPYMGRRIFFGCDAEI